MPGGLTLSFAMHLVMYFIIIHADGSHGLRFFTCICLFIRTISQKLMELEYRNVPRRRVLEISLFWSQKVKGQGHESQTHCRRGSLHSCECWLLLILCCIASVANELLHHRPWITCSASVSQLQPKPLTAARLDWTEKCSDEEVPARGTPFADRRSPVAIGTLTRFVTRCQSAPTSRRPH